MSWGRVSQVLAERPLAFWRAVVLAVFTLIWAAALMSDSAVIDGTRYFLLDDDQMVSMRYARNLVDGQGLVFNPGERVEGYSNFLWTMVMAGVHLLPIGDARTALVVKCLGWLLGCCLFFLSERLIIQLGARSKLTLVAMQFSLLFCIDFLFWCIHGFETTLLTVLFLAAILGILDHRRSSASFAVSSIALALIPLVRADGYHICLSLAILAFSTRGPVGTLKLLAIPILVNLAYLAFRYSYYGDLLPNTYYLKSAGLDHRFKRGLVYLLTFVLAYLVAIGLALVGIVRGRQDACRALLVGTVVSAGYVLIMGGDAFGFSRYMAHTVPVILALAIIGAREVVQPDDARWTAALPAACLALAMTSQGALSLFRAGLQDLNGEPRASLKAGLLIRDRSAPTAKVAVWAAGIVPYFSHRHSIDILGKTDAHVARLDMHPNQTIGHGKYDIEYSLGLSPDLVIGTRRHVLTKSLAAEDWAAFGPARQQFVTDLLGNQTFQTRYRPNPVADLGSFAIYARDSSGEALRARWSK